MGWVTVSVKGKVRRPGLHLVHVRTYLLRCRRTALLGVLLQKAV